MYKMYGQKAAAGMTKELNGYNGHVQISLNTRTGHIIASRIYNPRSYKIYDDDAIIFVEEFYFPATMEEIITACREALFRKGF